MSKWYKVTVFLIMLAVLTVSCRQLYTSSVGKVFARDGISIPQSTSIGDLVDMANGSESNSPAAAKEILDVLGGKPEADIQALSVDDQSAILNLASTAAIDLGTIDSIFAGYDEATSDTDALITQALDAFDSSVDMAAIEAILGDADALGSGGAPVESLVLASAVVLASVSDVIGTTAVMDILADPSPTAVDAYLPALKQEQKDSLKLVIGVRTAVDARVLAGEEGGTMAGFDLTDLLKGN